MVGGTTDGLSGLVVTGGLKDEGEKGLSDGKLVVGLITIILV